MVINELELGTSTTCTLLVKSCESKVARNGKPYLIMVLFDGIDEITANKWDHYGSFTPEPNCVLDVEAKVTDFNGKKQLTISQFRQNTEIDITMFMPRGDFDVNEYFEKASDLINSIKNDELRSVTAAIFSDNRWSMIPAAKGIHHAYVAGNLKHSVDTALKAKVLAEIIPGCNTDLCIAGALLHDVGKLQTYEFDQVIIGMTNAGMLLDHIALGMQILASYRTYANNDIVTLLQHIIASHHLELEYGSPVTPKCIEALIVGYCDGLDAKIATLQEETRKTKEGATLTGKIWSFGNHPVFTQSFVDKIME